MEEERGKQNPEQPKKKVAELLHKDAPLQSLRSYQGDVAEAIKKQNESVTTIAIKEHERKEERGEAPQSVGCSLPVNTFTLLLSLLLIGGSALAIFFIFQVIQDRPDIQAPVEISLIPVNNRVTIIGSTGTILRDELAKVEGSGLTLAKIESPDGKELRTGKQLLEFLGATTPSTFERNLNDIYALGVHISTAGKTRFLILRTRDFGIAFAGMLDWESSMRQSLAVLDTKTEGDIAYAWKDLIVKNKDVRALTNPINDDDVVIAYTFLDKNTILIANTFLGLNELSNIYASRAVAK